MSGYKVKTCIMWFLTAAAGAYTAYAFVHDFSSGAETMTLTTISFGVNLVFYCVLIFGMPFIDVDYGAYTTTTTTYTYEYGEVKTSVSTPEDKAEAATIWKRIGLIVLCYVCSPVSHLVFLFVIPISRNFPKRTWLKVLLISLGIAAVALVGTVLLWYPRLVDAHYARVGIIYEAKDDGTYAVVDCDSDGKKVTIPEKYRGGRVVEIRSGAFSDCKNMTDISIPSSVESIAAGAFAGCTSLKKIDINNKNPTYNSAGNCLIATESKRLVAMCKGSVIPSDGSVTSIGEAVCKHSGVSSIQIPESVTEIKDRAFYDCGSLKEIEIPDSVTKIGGGVFYGCVGLTSVKLGKNISALNTYRDNYNDNYNGFFEGCSSLTSITIPNSVTSIEKEVFSNCSGLTSVKYEGDIAGWCGISGLDNLDKSLVYIGDEKLTEITSITIPTGVTNIREDAFSGCSSLTSITIPNSVTSIGSYAFSGCSSLKSITIPTGLTSIGEHVFHSCEGLTNVTIPTGVTSIGEYAFYSCGGLTSVTIPKTVTSIGDCAFIYCSKLSNIKFNGTKKQWKAINKGSLWNYGSVKKVSCSNGTVSVD